MVCNFYSALLSDHCRNEGVTQCPVGSWFTKEGMCGDIILSSDIAITFNSRTNKDGDDKIQYNVVAGLSIEFLIKNLERDICVCISV